MTDFLWEGADGYSVFAVSDGLAGLSSSWFGFGFCLGLSVGFL